ncbi:MAG: DUF4105 domain-containing protein [Bacteroidales bacterium]|nr:DUF4105 domain-containing protein [Bacteroidales bacterium]
MTKTIRLLLAVVVACLACATARAQTDSTARADAPVVSLITCYPGENIYELYGHTQLRVRGTGYDWVFNYGTFDFRAPNFIYRFVKGETDYMLAGYPASYMLMGYESRKVVEQVLNLSPGQARSVRDALFNGARPENRTYRYNYVLDNCSTRPRDIVEAAVGTSLQYPAMPQGLTFRSMMHHYNQNYAWQQFGIDLALGPGLDYELTPRQQMFAPISLMTAFAGATVERDGKRVPLVASTEVINPGSDNGDILPPTPWPLRPLTLAMLLLGVAVAVSVRDVRRRKATLWLDCVLFSIATLAGMLVAFLVLISTHEATTPNYNLLWLHPLHIVAATLAWIKSAKKVVMWYHFLNFAVIFLTIALWALLPQCANAAFFPLMGTLAVRSLSYVVTNRQMQKNVLS